MDPNVTHLLFEGPALVVAAQPVAVGLGADDVTLLPLARAAQLHSLPARGRGGAVARVADQGTPGGQCYIII
jgi:hypothetical protein